VSCSFATAQGFAADMSELNTISKRGRNETRC